MSEKLQDVTADRAKRPSWLEGRCRRREYWLWVGPAMTAILVLGAIRLQLVAFPIGVLVTLVWVRRFHDLGRSGWWAPVVNIAVNVVSWAAVFLLGDVGGGVAALLFLAGAVITLGAVPGQPGRNEFGPPPGKRSVIDAFD